MNGKRAEYSCAVFLAFYTAWTSHECSSSLLVNPGCHQLLLRKTSVFALGGRTLRLRGGKATGLGQQLQQLQYVMKKDPDGYVPELEAQVSNFRHVLKACEMEPPQPYKELGELAIFLAHMCPNYPQRLHHIPEQLMNIMRFNHTVLPSETRTKICEAITLLCGRKMIPVPTMCSLYFSLFQLPDKKLRAYLFSACLSAIKRLNAKSVDQKANRQIQRELSELLHGESTRSGGLAISLFMDLFRRKMWDDDHVVNIIGAACFSRQNKVRGSAIHFLLGIDDEEEDGQDAFGLGDGDVERGGKRIKTSKLMTAKKHKKKALRKALKEQAKEDERIRLGGPAQRHKGQPRFAALDRLHDAQAFAERMLGLLVRWSSGLSLEHKLLMMDLISRLVATHRLLLLDFFDLLQRYLAPHQREIHRILALLAQAVHDLTPPDVVAGLLRNIADKFVRDGSKDEALLMGLNAIREIARRQPQGMEADLAGDLIGYQKHGTRPIANAARSLRKVLRELNPLVLHRRRDRGPPRREGSGNGKGGGGAYGTANALDRLAGAHVLDDLTPPLSLGTRVADDAQRLDRDLSVSSQLGPEDAESGLDHGEGFGVEAAHKGGKGGGGALQALLASSGGAANGEGEDAQPWVAPVKWWSNLTESRDGGGSKSRHGLKRRGRADEGWGGVTKANDPHGWSHADPTLPPPPQRRRFDEISNEEFSNRYALDNGLRRRAVAAGVPLGRDGVLFDDVSEEAARSTSQQSLKVPPASVLPSGPAQTAPGWQLSAAVMALVHRLAGRPGGPLSEGAIGHVPLIEPAQQPGRPPLDDSDKGNASAPYGRKPVSLSDTLTPRDPAADPPTKRMVGPALSVESDLAGSEAEQGTTNPQAAREEGVRNGTGYGGSTGLPVEMTRILTDEDLDKMRANAADSDGEAPFGRLRGEELLAGRRRRRGKAVKGEEEGKVGVRRGLGGQVKKEAPRRGGLRNVDKARLQPVAMLRHKRSKERAKARDQHVNPRVERKRHRGHFHKVHRS